MQRGTYIRTEKIRTKQSQKMLGKKYPNRKKPKSFSKTHRQNISKTKIGKKQSVEHIKHSSQANIKEKIPIICQFCKTIKYVIPSKSNTQFCSRQCHYSAGCSDEQKEKLRQKRLSQKILFKDTSIEIKMQNILRKNNIKFEKQKPLLKKFIVDIFIEPNTVIECDGDYWHNREDIKQKDVIKNLELKKAGYQLLRFWEHEINNDIEKCFTVIHHKIFQEEII